MTDLQKGEDTYVKALQQIFTDPEARKAAFKELQTELYENVGFIKIGNFNALQGKSKTLEGVSASPWPQFWNASTSE